MGMFDWFNPFHNDFLDADMRYQARKYQSMSHHNCYNKHETDELIKCYAPLMASINTQNIIDMLPDDGKEMINVAEFRKKLSDLRGEQEDEARKFRSFNMLWRMIQERLK